jgi:phytoene dehydrogenase-like protein
MTEAVVVGSGPNGLSAAICLARAGLEVSVLEAAQTAGGASSSAEVTLPGFIHDLCAAVHPLAAASPFLSSLDISGVLAWSDPSFAHPLEGESAAALWESPEQTADSLGADGARYLRLMRGLWADPEGVISDLLEAVPIPRRTWRSALMALGGLLPANILGAYFRQEKARALLAGAAAHSMRPLSSSPTGAYGLLFLGLGHWPGWPVAKGGSSSLVKILLGELGRLGGKVVTGHRVDSLQELSAARLVLLDTSFPEFLRLARGRLPSSYVSRARRFRYGPAYCKVDWALDGAVPWLAPECRKALSLHVGGSFAEIAAAEEEVWRGRHPDRPFVLVCQPGVVDPSRAPAGKATLWAYCHVPPGSDVDMAPRIEAQIERFAPGFRDLVLARRTTTAAEAAAQNANHPQGSIGGGDGSLWGLAFRPRTRLSPYRTPIPGVYLCSSSTPPGPGVHGMCGLHAAQLALADLRRGL